MFGKKCNKGFLPSGKDTILAAVLLGVISACGLYTYTRMNSLITEELPATAVSQLSFSQSSFNIENASIPKEQILSGGVPKDGIPSLTHPEMIAASKATYLNPEDRVVGVVIQGEARAYPLRILAWHECVNETVGDSNFAVIYCPLCDSTNVFNREVNGEVLEFGISGNLYQSNVLLYDRQKDPSQESLWSQMFGEAVSGPKKGTRLETLPHRLLTWESWKTEHPETTVLSLKTGHSRNYSPDYYPRYFASPDLMFPVYNTDKRFLYKDIVIGIRYNGIARAYPVEHIDFGDGTIEDTLGGKKVTLTKKPAGDVAVDFEGERDVYHSFWFAWYAFHPETEIYSGEGFDLDEWIKKNEKTL